VALTPLLVAVLQPSAGGTPPRGAFLLGLTTGAFYFSGTLYWLVETMTTFGGLPTAVALFAAAALVAYLSLFPAAFAVIVARLRSTGSLALALWCAPAAWVASELGRQYVWDGFPWALLGYSQVTLLPVAQLASVTGVYGLSGLLALTSTAAAFAAIGKGRERWLALAGAVGVVVVISVWGAVRMAGEALTHAGTAVRVAVLQGNIAQDDKWDPALRDAIIGRYIAQTRDAIGRGATFILWPESSLPVYFEDDTLRGTVIRKLAQDAGVTLLVGSDQLERPTRGAPIDSPDNRLYNAAFLVKPDGTVGAVYRKQQLVPFGEYVPLQRLLFFVGPIVESVSNFTPGREATLLPIGSHRASTAICYEVIYGSLIRRFVADGTELLTTITNDAWYGRSSAAYQHWDQATMRSIENGRYLARAANTGVSGFVDPYGRVIEKSGLFEPATLVADVRFLQTRTIYSRTGDLIAWLSLALVIAALLATRRRQPRPL